MAVHWPGMTSAIRDHVSRCSTCNTFRPEQQRESMMPHDVPARPWAKVGMDLFEIDSVHYLITVDYYSNFFEVDKLNNTLAVTVIHKVKAHFARHGIPDTVISDNGPQFASGEFKAFAKTWRFKHDTSSQSRKQRQYLQEHYQEMCQCKDGYLSGSTRFPKYAF
eukprot:m.303816 g.303816  ORF g.303816 m.303816 type:complete len:164 (+) comp40841_c0_seq7:1-492(+)